MQKILGQVRRCVEDYHMIDAGDVVAVGVSGGKDSLLLLYALALTAAPSRVRRGISTHWIPASGSFWPMTSL